MLISLGNMYVGEYMVTLLSEPPAASWLPFGEYAIAGAKAGRLFGELNKNTDTMNLINDYEWLKNKFKNDFA